MAAPSSPASRPSRLPRSTRRTPDTHCAPCSRPGVRMHTQRVKKSSARAKALALPRAFYDRPTLVVAQELLGKVLVHRSAGGVASGMIVEAEAYIGEDDPACHAAPGPTRRNEPLYGPPGVAYVYLNYGIHYLVNAVTEADGHPAAVLIRALEPLDGILLMGKRRFPDGRHVDVTD